MIDYRLPCPTSALGMYAPVPDPIPRTEPERGIIYRITNLVKGWVYIGKSANTFAERYSRGEWWKHTHNRELKEDYARYGAEAFEVEILVDGLTEEEMQMAEPMLIQSHNCLHPNGYNHVVASHTTRVSEATRERMRKSHLGKKLTQAQRDAMSKARLGVPHPTRGIPKSPEHREHIKQACLRFHASHAPRLGGEHHAAKAIERVSIETGEVLQVYASIADANREGYHCGQIISVCKGLAKRYRGFGWRYVK